LATSTKHNDLVLRYMHPDSPDEISSKPPAPTKACFDVRSPRPAGGMRGCPSQASTAADTPATPLSVASTPEVVPEPCELDSVETPRTTNLSPRTIELEALRAENAQLKKQNEELLLEKDRTRSARISHQQKTPTRWADIYDDPYEPPPDANTFQKLQLPWMASISSPTCGSTAGGSDWSSPSLSSCGTPMSMKSGMTATCFAIHSGYGTPIHSGYGTPTLMPMTPRPDSDPHSGVMTPQAVMSQASPSAASVGQQVCALVPMWFSLVGDRCVIPGGIVEKFKAKFEPEGGPQHGSSQAGEALNF